MTPWLTVRILSGVRCAEPVLQQLIVRINIGPSR